MSDTRTRALEMVFPMGMETYWRYRTEDAMSIEKAAECTSLGFLFDLFSGPRMQAESIKWANRSREELRQLESWYRLRLAYRAEAPEAE